MRKIKDNGRTLIKVDMPQWYFNVCHLCKRTCTFEESKERDCGTDSYWRETIPSKLSRIIKRMVRK